MRMGVASAWRVCLEIRVTAVAMVTMVSMPTAAQVAKQRLSRSHSDVWLPLIGCYLFSQHATVITLEGTVIQRTARASARHTQRETLVTGVRPVTGVMTPPQVARYTCTHRYTPMYMNTHTGVWIDTLTSWCLFSRAAARWLEAPPLSVS